MAREIQCIPRCYSMCPVGKCRNRMNGWHEPGLNPCIFHQYSVRNEKSRYWDSTILRKQRSKSVEKSKRLHCDTIFQQKRFNLYPHLLQSLYSSFMMVSKDSELSEKTICIVPFEMTHIGEQKLLLEFSNHKTAYK
ncbi:hypothetical protein L3Y34_001525 [Caenorhabditis briggsae]|uniref:Uncharacterized protein n=1 Tax=Caenorhabditis briggsae TaxID=6238 RepID=A0AAE9DCM5_CAEBR|nr:hypothetical protein L3Y34_001525 [Caenorhabditis briggsae]